MLGAFGEAGARFLTDISLGAKHRGCTWHTWLKAWGNTHSAMLCLRSVSQKPGKTVISAQWVGSQDSYIFSIWFSFFIDDSMQQQKNQLELTEPAVLITVLPMPLQFWDRWVIFHQLLRCPPAYLNSKLPFIHPTSTTFNINICLIQEYEKYLPGKI